MVHILFLILKIIGIVLLVLFTLAFLILLFPISYRAKADLNEKSYNATVKAFWLFGIVHFGFVINNTGKKYCLRILGIPVKRYSEKEKHSKKSEDDFKYIVKKETAENTISKDELQTPVKTEGRQGNADNKDKSDIININIQEEDVSEKQKDATLKKPKDKPKKKIKISEIITKIKDKIKDIYNRIKEGFQNLDNLKKKVARYKKILTANRTKEAYRFAKKYVLKILKHIRPKKVRGNLRIGFEYPDETGKAIGHIAVIFGMFNINPKHFRINADFENKVMEGNIKAKGTVTVGIAGYYILRLYWNKKLRSVIRKLS